MRRTSVIALAAYLTCAPLRVSNAQPAPAEAAPAEAAPAPAANPAEPLPPPPGGMSPATRAPGEGEPVRVEAAKTAYEESAERVDEQLKELANVPETPAAFALGLSPEVVAHPGTIRETIAELKTLFGPSGELVPGAAVEVAPFYRWASSGTYIQWREEPLRQLLGGLRLSVATASDPRAPGADDAPVLLALGARIGFDTTDPRFHDDAVKALKNALEDCAPPPGTLPPGQPGEGQPVVMTPAAGSCDFEKAEEEILDGLTGHRFELAGTVTYEAPAGTDQDADFRAWQSWLAYEGRVTSYVGLGLGADVKHERVAAVSEWHLRFGGRVAVNTDDYGAALSGAYSRRTEAGENWADLGAVVSAHLGSLAVLKLGAQAAQNLDDDQTDLIVMLGLGTASGDPIYTKYLRPTSTSP